MKHFQEFYEIEKDSKYGDLEAIYKSELIYMKFHIDYYIWKKSSYLMSWISDEKSVILG